MRHLKQAVTLAVSMSLTFGMGACSAKAPTDEQAAETTTAEDAGTTAGTDSNDPAIQATTSVANTIAEDEETLVSTIPERFTQETYTDDETGLSITYNLFLPASYDENGSYPLVVFIADSSCTGDDATRSLTQGRGALVWATDEWQAAHPSIVVVPTYPETILDDHDGYTTTPYVELTKRFIDHMSANYAVDQSRVFGTGQSMGCMTTLILASQYPDLYAGCMFVDGQWDTTTLAGLENQTFVYFAAEDDTSAWTGSQELMQLFDTNGTTYGYMQWQGNWTPDELSQAAGRRRRWGRLHNGRCRLSHGLLRLCLPLRCRYGMALQPGRIDTTPRDRLPKRRPSPSRDASSSPTRDVWDKKAAASVPCRLDLVQILCHDAGRRGTEVGAGALAVIGLRTPLGRRHVRSLSETEQLTADDRTVLVTVAAGNLLHLLVEALLCRIGLRVAIAFDQSHDHEGSGHAATDLTHPSHATPEGRGHAGHHLRVNSRLLEGVHVGHHHRLGAVISVQEVLAGTRCPFLRIIHVVSHHTSMPYG